MQHLLEVLHSFIQKMPASRPVSGGELEAEPSSDWLLLFALTLDERRIVETRERSLPH